MQSKKIIIVIYIILIIISSSWAWIVNLNLIEWLTLAVLWATGVLIMLDWFRRLDFEYQRKLHDRDKERENLFKQIHEHNQSLINVFKEWIKIEEHSGTFDYKNYVYQTPLAIAHFGVHCKSKKSDPKELNLKAMEHLKANEYIYIRDLWNENCIKGSNDLLDIIIRIWEDIEKKITSDPISSDFIECEFRTNPLPTCYDLRETVWWIYQEADYYSNKSELLGTFKRYDKPGFFEVGRGTIQTITDLNMWVNFFSESPIYARTTTKDLADKFIGIANGIITSADIIERLKIRDKEEERLERNIKKFKEELKKVIDDFNNKNIELYGICGDCKDWYKKLNDLK